MAALIVMSLLGSLVAVDTVHGADRRIGLRNGSIQDVDGAHNSVRSVLLNPNAGDYLEYSYDPANLKGEANVVIGFGSIAASINKSTAVGAGSYVTNNLFGLTNGAGRDGQATAYGSYAQAAEQATSVGNDTYAVGRSSIAIGNDDNAAYKGSVTSYDYDNYFKGLYTAINPSGDKYGYGTNGSKEAWRRIWSPTLAQGHGSIAIGSRSLAYADGTTAVGTLAFALKQGATAIGTETRAEGVGATAFGSKTYVFSDNSIAVGSKSQVLNQGGTAYGYKSYSAGDNSIAIGRDVYANTNMVFKPYNGAGANVFSANGLYNLDPAKAARSVVANLSVNDVYLTNDGYDRSQTFIDNLETLITKEVEDGSVGLGYATATTETHNGVDGIVQQEGKNAIVVGSRSLALGSNGMAFGRGAIEKGDNSMALGSYSMTDGKNSIALGLASRAVNNNSLAIGTASATMGERSLSAGVATVNYGNRSTVVGYGSGISSNSYKSTVLGTNSIIGKGIGNSIVIGSNASVGKYVQMPNELIYKINPKTGKVDSTQALMNLSDMEADKIENAMAIGSNARVYSRDASADRSDSLAKENGNNAMAIGNGAQAWLENSLALGVNSKTDYSPTQLASEAWRTPDAIAVSTTSKVGVISVGSLGNERRIVNVAAGAYDTDAVNVSQLKQLYDSMRRQIDAGDAESGGHYLSTNYQSNNGIQSVDYPKKYMTQLTYDRYVKAYTDYKTYLVKEAFGGGKLTDNAKASFNKELTKLEKQLEGYGVTKEQLQNLQVNIFGGGSKTTSTDGTITDVSIDSTITTTYDNVEDALKALTNASTTDENAVTDLIGMSLDDLQAKLKEINYTNQNATGKGSVAIGYSASTKADGAIAIGNMAKVDTGDKSVAIGDHATVETTDVANATTAGISYDNNKPVGIVGTPNAGVFSVGTIKNDEEGYVPSTRRIINVAAGLSDTDAVNVAQLKSLASQTVKLVDSSGTKTSGQAIGSVNGVELSIVGGDEPAQGETVRTNTTGSYSGKNIKTEATAKGLVIKIADNPEFTSVVVGTPTAAHTMVDATGITGYSADGTKANAINLGTAGQVNFANGTTNAVLKGVASGFGTTKKDNTEEVVPETITNIKADSPSLTNAANIGDLKAVYTTLDKAISDANAVVDGFKFQISDGTQETVENQQVLRTAEVNVKQNGASTLVIKGITTKGESNQADKTYVTTTLDVANKMIGVDLTDSAKQAIDNVNNGNMKFTVTADNPEATDGQATVKRTVKADGDNVTLEGIGILGATNGNIATTIDANGNVRINTKAVLDYITSIGGGKETIAGASTTVEKGKITFGVGKDANNKDIGTVDVNSGRITHVADAVENTDAINKKQLDAVKDLIANTDKDGKVTVKKISVTGDGAVQNTAYNVGLGDTLAIKGGDAVVSDGTSTRNYTNGTFSGKNIKTRTTNNALEIQLADNPEFTSVVVGTPTGARTTVDASSITGYNGDGTKLMLLTLALQDK